MTPALPAPWPALVLDSGGLTALADNKEKARGVLALSEMGAAPVLLPAVVIAESTRGTVQDARVNRVIARVEVVDIDEGVAREAARLKTQADMTGVEHTVDALVVAVAVLAGGAAILTSDRTDIGILADQRPNLTIKALPV